jgi:hypothetical protein
MNLDESIDDLQRVAEYRRAVRTLRGFAIGAAVFGVIAVVTGSALLAQNPLNIILIGIGLLLIAEAIWNVVAPSAIGILVDAVVLLIVALWNIGITVLELAAGALTDARWGIIGVVQIGIAIYRFTTFPRFQAALQEKPDAEDVRHLDELVKTILKAKAKEEDNLIGFQQKDPFKAMAWRAQLADNAAIFVAKQGHDVILAHKEAVEIEVTGKVFLGKTLKAKLRIKDRTMNGTISPESYAKYEHWKIPNVEPA